jgi:hypothetical protein
MLLGSFTGRELGEAACPVVVVSRGASTTLGTSRATLHAAEA